MELLVITAGWTSQQYECILHGDCTVQSGTAHLRIFQVTWKEISLLPTLTPSQGLKNWYFIMKFFPQDHLYVNDIRVKFQGQKIYTRKVI